MSAHLDVVTPLLRSDFDRYKLQLRTLQEFYRIRGKFYVLVHRVEADAVWLAALKALDSNIVVLFQDDLIHPSAIDLSGWYGQQLAKLAMANVVESSAYLCLDADTLLGRIVAPEDLMPDGLPLYNREPMPEMVSHLKFLQQSALMMCVPFNTLQFTSEWSTKIMRTDVVKGLHAHLQDCYEMPWDAALVAAILRSGRAWGEYLLYHIELERTGALVRHTCVEHSLNGAYFWDKGQHVNWAVDSMGAGPFILAGSKAGVSAHWVRERLSAQFPFLRYVRFLTD